MTDRAFFATFAAAMFVIAAMLLVTLWLARQPLKCATVPYDVGGRPVCMIVKREAP